MSLLIDENLSDRLPRFWKTYSQVHSTSGTLGSNPPKSVCDNRISPTRHPRESGDPETSLTGDKAGIGVNSQ